MVGTSPRRATRRSFMDREIPAWRMFPTNGSASTRYWKRPEPTRSPRWPSLVPAPTKTDRGRSDHQARPLWTPELPLALGNPLGRLGAIPAVYVDKEVPGPCVSVVDCSC